MLLFEEDIESINRVRAYSAQEAKDTTSGVSDVVTNVSTSRF
jgi:hypothetical protein